MYYIGRGRCWPCMYVAVRTAAVVYTAGWLVMVALLTLPTIPRLAQHKERLSYCRGTHAQRAPVHRCHTGTHQPASQPRRARLLIKLSSCLSLVFPMDIRPPAECALLTRGMNAHAAMGE